MHGVSVKMAQFWSVLMETNQVDKTISRSVQRLQLQKCIVQGESGVGREGLCWGWQYALAEPATYLSSRVHWLAASFIWLTAWLAEWRSCSGSSISIPVNPMSPPKYRLYATIIQLAWIVGILEATVGSRVWNWWSVKLHHLASQTVSHTYESPMRQEWILRTLDSLVLPKIQVKDLTQADTSHIIIEWVSGK